jgi:NitT/TauT family transport system permease protein
VRAHLDPHRLVSALARLGSGPRARMALSLLSLVFVLSLWQWSSALLDSSIIFPSAGATFAALFKQFGSGEIFNHIGITAYRVLAGFFLGSTSGALLGLLVGSFPLVRKFLEPYTNFFRFITPIAWVTPAVIWFGVGEGSKLFLVVYSTLFIVLLNTAFGVTHIHRDRLRMAHAFGAAPWQLFFYITLPATVGFILTGMRIALGNAFMTVVSVEVLSANSGLGYLIYSSRVYFRSDVMFAAILLLGGMGFSADRLFAWVQHRLLWRYQVGRRL